MFNQYRLRMHDLEILLDDRPDALAEMGDALGAAGVSIEGGGMFVIAGRSVTHFLFDDGDAAREALESVGITVEAAARRTYNVSTRPVPASSAPSPGGWQTQAPRSRCCTATTTISSWWSSTTRQPVLLCRKPGQKKGAGASAGEVVTRLTWARNARRRRRPPLVRPGGSGSGAMDRAPLDAASSSIRRRVDLASSGSASPIPSTRSPRPAQGVDDVAADQRALAG